MVMCSRAFAAYASVALQLHVYACDTHVCMRSSKHLRDRRERQIETETETERKKKEIISVLKLRNLLSMCLVCC